MTKVDVNDFNQENECIYKGRRYSVRDNGAVLRHPKEGQPARGYDNQWTFGKENSSNAYLHIAGVQIHRIVATAFYGNPPNPTDVVDHEDSNCKNNRPDNLRWCSRLENALNNPATRKKIEYLCGSIEAFLDNPSMLRNLAGSSHFSWMRRVTPEEAQNCKLRMKIWGSSKTKPKKSTGVVNQKYSLDERVYQPLQKWEVGLPDREPGLNIALTPWCASFMFPDAPHFPCCPTDFSKDRLYDYFQNIKAGDVLAYFEHNEICDKLTVIDSEILIEKSAILILCKIADDQWAIVGIELHDRSNHFVHFWLGLYSSKEKAEKALPAKRESDFWSEVYNIH